MSGSIGNQIEGNLSPMTEGILRSREFMGARLESMNVTFK
jgi:hypothetical protein